MAEKVVGLRGEIVPQAVGVVSDVVKLLEDMLERARSGDVVGVSVAVQHSDECCQWYRAGLSSYRLLGFVHGMAFEMTDQLMADQLSKDI
jgi:hypothetical protein